tara:strand:+ start:329 stop:1753 length:1425 start_codon:yes stop_codon:yes gene_type:complete
MAINWSAGLISAGGSLKDYSAVLLKEEYMADAKATAAHTSLMDRYTTLLDTVTSSISDNTTDMGQIIDPERQESLYTYQNVLINALQTGKQIPATTLQAMAEEVAKGGTQDTEKESEDVEAASGFWSAMYADTLGQALPEAMSWIKEKMEENLKGLSEEEIKKPETIIKSAKKIPGAWASIKDWWASTSRGDERLDTEKPADVEEADPSLQSTYEDPFGVGLINQGTATPEQEATMAAGGVQGGSGYVEPEIAQETVSDISGVVGSEEALTSLFRDVGGPVGEPAGKTTVRDYVIGKPEVEIEVSPPEIEERKSTILSNVFSAIRDAESNVMGYSAVSDTTDGDRGLTTSTVGEIVNKHGNKAIGIGQFKFNEFMKPTAKKWFGMSEAQLKDQMFTPQFQDALVVAGLYDAGLQQFADGKIDAATFQKRIANIWRGLPPDKDTKEGDPTDDLGNKARMSGEELRGLIEQGMTGQ